MLFVCAGLITGAVFALFGEKTRVEAKTMKHNNVCIKCSALLVVGENITQSMIDHYNYICRKCKSKYATDYNHRTGRKHAMSENRECSTFLGVYVAERVLSHVFKDVQRMPYGTPGFDFRCGKGYMVDVKSSCRHHHPRWADSWLFHIRKNPVAEYFLCLAFDNRYVLDPEHIWLIPAGDINDRDTIGITESKLDKWQKYEQSVDRVIACCNAMKT